ncbi:Alpha/Beta hydrolase protein, partial [Gautieria morchelliformis]
FPVILIHAYLDVPVITGTWKLIEKFLSEKGVEYFTPHIPPHGSIDERSISLIDQIASRYCGQTVHLFGQSMGGINARDIASRAMTSDLGFQIKTVTTFGSPHRGVKMINFAPATPNALGDLIRSIIGSDLGAFGNLTENYMTDYNRRTVNNPSVRYFSWAGLIQIPSGIRLYGPTDGLVNVSSATWGNDLGPGTHLGTLDGLDHTAIVSIVTVAATIPHLSAAENGRTAPVEPIDNSFGPSLTRAVEGGINTALAPTRGLFALTGLRF